MSVRILLVSHGELAAAAAGSARMIVGDSFPAETIMLGEEEGIEKFRTQLQAYYMEKKDSEILTVCDIPNGSPYITACLESKKILKEGNYAVIAGMNLGMLLEILTSSPDRTLEEMKKAALEAGTDTVMEYQPLAAEDMEEEL